MSLATLRAAIVAKVAALPAIGVVHDRERYLDNQAALRALYVSTFPEGERLQGWYVSWTDMNPTSRDEREDVWTIVGYRAVHDESSSETEFALLADQVVQAFRDYDPLGQPGVTTLNASQAGPSLEAMDHVMFCGVLCHRVAVKLITASYTAVQGQ